MDYAYAMAGQGEAGPQGFAAFVPLILIFVIFYFLLIRPQQKKAKQQKEFIDNLKAIGGTNIDEAITLASKMKKRKGRPYMIVFLTDGKPTIGETDEDTLLKKIKKTFEDAVRSTPRIFTFGIGHDINIHLLDKITEMTRAFRSYISPDEDIEIKVSNFYSKI